MNCNCDAKRKLNEYEIKCERLLFKLKEYEQETCGLKKMIDEIKNQQQSSIETLSEKVDSLLSSNLSEDSNLHKNLIDILLSCLLDLTCYKRLPSNELLELIEKITKLKNSTDLNSQIEKKLQEQHHLAEKELFSLKKKLKQTKFELDSLKLKLNNPALMTPSTSTMSSSPSTSTTTTSNQIDTLDLKLKTNSLRNMIDQQNVLIRNLFEILSVEYTDKISKSKVVASCSPAAPSSTYSSVQSTNKSTSNDTASNNNIHTINNNSNNLTSTIKNEIYLCPKCNTSFDSSRISTKRYEMHLNECDANNKLVCVFCSKLFDKKEQKPYETHIQSHLAKTSLTKSPTTTVSSHDYFCLNNFEDKLSSGSTSSTSSNFNSSLASSKNSSAKEMISKTNQSTTRNHSYSNLNSSNKQEHSQNNNNSNHEKNIDQEINDYLDLNNNVVSDTNKNILISEFHPRIRKRL